MLNNKILSKTQLERLAFVKDDDLLKEFPGFSRSYLRNQKCKLPPVEKSISQDKTIDTLKSSLTVIEHKYKKLLEINEFLETKNNALIDIKNSSETYRILPSDKSGTSEASAVILLSDIHYEERVDKPSINGLNEYTLQIADRRINNFFINAVRLLNIQKTAININNIVLALLGDFISGNIHEELLESNQLLPMEAIIRVQARIIAGIEYLLGNTDCKITVPCHSGNHCVDENTEILTKDGFKKAKHITKEDVVASFEKENGNISYDLVVAMEKFSAKGAYNVFGRHKNELVTPKHNLVINNNFVKAEEFISGNRDDFRHSGVYISKPVDIDDNMLRLLTWVVMDGTIVDNSKYLKNSTKKRIQFKLSKKRKIDELITLLNEIGINYTFKKATKSGCNVLQPYYIRIYGDEARKIYSYFPKRKLLPSFYKDLSSKQLKIVLETIATTDGRVNGGSIEWSSIEKKNIELIQIACIRNNIACNYRKLKKCGGFKSRKPIYISNIYFNGFNNDKNQIINSKFIDKTFNFVGIQTKNGTLITRRGGIVNFTGNSRITDKTHISTENGNSLEYLMYHNIAQRFSGEERLKFIISESYHSYLDVYNYTLRFQHGHFIKYGGGVGGIYIPLNKAIAQWNKAKHADIDCVAHFHQLKDGGNFIVNGSVIGYNKYAMSIKADYEEPKQAFFLVDKNRGKTISAPIFLDKN